MTGKHGCAVTLRRANPNQPWGIRIVGGCDLDKPIVIIRAVAGTPAEGLVKPGDEILQIGDYDARDIRHQDAQGLFKNAGNSIKIVIHRAGGGSTSSRSREQSVDPLGLPRALGSLPEYQSNTISPTCGPNPAIISHSRASSVCSTYDEERSGLEQPYRTTPLVLPGAKVKKDFGQTESYLRHHPNPMFRQAPPHPLLPHELAMKQRVADTVIQKIEEQCGPGKQISHKQFNSPMGLYSEQNIVDTINQQSGAQAPVNVPAPAPFKKTVVYDPAKSETFKALQDNAHGYDNTVHEVTPVPSKVFTPVKRVIPTPPQARNTPAPHPVPAPHSLQGQSNEEIQQSYTFKRLMHMVQSEEGVY
uniref:PDZ and LIM domain protein 3 n=1 Tax=Lygus hesperus TaxID=30085 RepID=A0A0A9VQJ2_LYGHE